MALLNHLRSVAETAGARLLAPQLRENEVGKPSRWSASSRQRFRQSGWPRAALLSLLAILMSLGICAPRVQGEAFKEYELKAAFLYNFAQFVDWPLEAFPEADTPLVIGVLGSDPFGATLDTLVQNEVVKNRKLIVRRYRQVEEVDLCHILFVSGSETERFERIFALLKGRPILTVGDTASFAFRGGVIRFLTEKNRIRLRINMKAARAANLTISSKLLRAAEVVGNDELGRRF
jgi:YfiR/HmsC-like